MRLSLLLLTVTLGACELSDECADAGTCEADSGVRSAPGTWSVFEHPCGENRTDALLVEGSSLWVGCGTGAEGRGLWTSSDGGETWAAVETEPRGVFETWRVNDVQRGADGFIYVGGIDTASSTTVARLDTTQSPAVMTSLYERGDQVGTSFQVGSLAVTAGGAMIAESLTGTDLVHRTGPEAAWRPSDRYTSDGESYQLTQVVAHDDRFYGCGSTIIQPPTVFLPNRSGADPEALFEAVSLADVRGELWGVAVSPGGTVVAAGVNQDRDVGLAFVSGASPYERADWKVFDVSSVVEGASWLRAACASDDTLVVVGEMSRGDGALAFLSDDNGVSWTNVTPPNAPASLTRCQITPAGVWAAGSFGWVGLLARP